MEVEVTTKVPSFVTCVYAIVVLVFLSSSSEDRVQPSGEHSCFS